MRLHLLCEFVFSQFVTFSSFTASFDLISPRLYSCLHSCSPSQIWTICISCSSSIYVSYVHLWGFPLSNSAMSVLHRLVWSAACYHRIPVLNWSRRSAEKKDQLWVTPLVHVCKWKTLPTKYSLITQHAIQPPHNHWSMRKSTKKECFASRMWTVSSVSTWGQFCRLHPRHIYSMASASERHNSMHRQ
jgi:hypothetical protein